MRLTSAHRTALRAVLDGTYTPLDVREFVQLCYVLALPLIRSKILRGKLNLELLGLKEVDLVYDCLADLFRRDSEGTFVQVNTFFFNQKIDVATCHEDEVFLALRRLVFRKVHHSIIRLYSDADPALGKILRNVQLELERNDLFQLQVRFGETCLVATGTDPCYHLPPMRSEFLRQRFSRVVSLHDSIPEMVEKLRAVLVRQEEYQRAVPLITAGLLFKEVYALGWEVQEAEASTVDRQAEQADVRQIAEAVCRQLAAGARETYVGKGKRSEATFNSYIAAVHGILLGEFGAFGADGASYYEHLRAVMPGLTKAAYANRHRAVLEYLAKRAKNHMRHELKRAESVGG